MVVEIALVLAVPVVLGVAAGFFEVNPIEAEMLSPVGGEAHLLLDAFPDDSLVVEIAYQSSIGPPPLVAVSTLFARINQTCQKASVTLDEHSFSSSQSSFSVSDLVALEPHVRQTWPTWGTMSLFYFYLDATASDNPNEIGVAYRGSSIAVFAATIQATPGFATPTAVTTTVMIHEFGHDLGLVGIDGLAPNEDPHHIYHSNDSSDVMYWAVDTTALSSLSGSTPTNFSQADLNDLKTVRGTLVPYEILPWIVLVVSGLVALLLAVTRPAVEVSAPPAPAAR